MEPKDDEDEEVILPEEGSGKAFERDLDEIYGRDEEKECTGASSDSV